MTRWPAITVALAISACEHGQTPPPGCGNGVLDFGEQCDDGNDEPDDGCDQCLRPNNCGNGLLDFDEQCDDGNTIDGDGCSSSCFVEGQLSGFMTSVWTFQDLDGTITGCPVGFPRIDIIMLGQLSGPFVESFDCVNGSAFSQQLPRDLFTVQAQVVSMDAAQVFATSLPQEVDLRVSDGTFSTVIFNDAGFFGMSWVLRGAVTNNVLNCAQANVAAIEITTSPSGTADLLDCTAGSGFTSALAAGSYTVSTTAENASSQTVGTATPIASQTITVPNGITGLGTIEIPIAGM